MVSDLSIKQRASNKAGSEVCYLRLFTDLHMCANMETHTHAHEMKKVKERRREGGARGRESHSSALANAMVVDSSYK